MFTRSTRRQKTPLRKLLVIAATLACAAGAANAGTASLKITSVDVNTDAFSNLYVWSVDSSQSFTMTAQNGGGLYGSASDNYSAANQNLGLNRSATTSAASAMGNEVQFTNAATGATTGGYNLSATTTAGVYPQPSLPDLAQANGSNAGRFTLLDETGNFAAGAITFDIYYTLSVATPSSTASNFSQASLTANGSNGGSRPVSFSDSLLSTSLTGGTGSMSGHFTWTYSLAAGQYASYSLAGTALASAVPPVPEPETYALLSMGLAAVFLSARRKSKTVG